MSAIEALAVAREHGVRITAEGAALRWRAPQTPPPAAIETLKRHKAEIVDYLRERKKRAHALPPALLPGRCAECSGVDDGTLSVVIELARPGQPWRHAQCYSQWINETGKEEAAR
jgi:hypothetical protein